MDDYDKIKITQKDPTTGAWFEFSSDDKNDRFCQIRSRYLISFHPRIPLITII